MNESEVAALVSQVLKEMTGQAAPSAPAPVKKSAAPAANNGAIPKTARGGMLTALHKFEVQE